MAQEVKDPALSLQWLGLHPWPSVFPHAVGGPKMEKNNNNNRKKNQMCNSLAPVTVFSNNAPPTLPEPSHFLINRCSAGVPWWPTS